MLQRRKKGFTIVELVVVIAVVAVLAAVLIPTFANIVKKAKISNDTVLVKNLNTALATSAAIDGTPKTMHEVLARVAENGYNVDKLTPTSTGDILWDQITNRFVLKDGVNVVFAENKAAVSPDYALWKITKSADEVITGEYSYYLDSGFAASGVLNVKNGIDTGSNTGLEINLENSGQVTLVTRTNAGNSFTVNAPQATVYHYGELNNLNITAVADASYHEHGTIKGNVTIAQGRFVAEAGSSVSVIRPTAASVKIEASEQAKVSAIVADAAILNNNENIKLPATVEKVEANENVVANMGKFAGGIGTEKAPYLIATQEHFMNIATFNGDPTPRYYLQTADLAMNTCLYANGNTISGVYDGGNHRISTTIYFADGSEYMYLFNKIAGKTTFKNMVVEMDSKPLAILCTADWCTSYGATFENITFNAKQDLLELRSTNFGFCVINPVYTYDEAYYNQRAEIEASNTTYPKAEYVFRNITNNVNIQNAGTCTGMLIGSGPYCYAPTKFVVENCVNNGNIKSQFSAGFVYGNTAYIADKNGVYDYYPFKQEDFVLNNNTNNGIISAGSIAEFLPVSQKTTKNGQFVDGLNDQNKAKTLEGTAGGYTTRDDLKNVNIAILQEGNQFTINVAEKKEGVTYKLFVNVYTEARTLSGGEWTEAHTQAYNEDDTTMYGYANGVKHAISSITGEGTNATNAFSIHAYDIRTAKANGIVANDFTFEEGQEVVVVVKDNKNYLIVNTTSNQYVNSAAHFLVYAYEGSTLVGTKVVG